MWIKKYISKNLGKIDCTQFVELVLNSEFNRSYRFPQGEGSIFQRANLLKKHMPDYVVETFDPKNGDLVLMNGERRQCHVGLYFDGGVLHKDENMLSGSYHKIKDLMISGYTIRGFYTWVR